ncbi:hypothetical protein BGZ80_009516 [Entomortierella chlamydospora]|uniref:Arm-like repeat domain-containing protein n=1 Tax=Entomortierella chlamydospora TaxID=101097 RepID=A0A9P6MX82_9FUNG|nr:hypothetical protein BGZ80_009516 [Entomortierella chlamydospora]
MSWNPFSHKSKNLHRKKSEKHGKPGSSDLHGLTQSLILPGALFAAPTTAGAMSQGASDSNNVQQPVQKIPDQNTSPIVANYVLPEVGARITNTIQLAYCLRLLSASLVSREELSQAEFRWLQTNFNNLNEQDRLKSIASDLVKAFIQDERKELGVVNEVTLLAAVLDQSDFRRLLQAFIDGIDQSASLEVHLLDGLAQLIRNAPQGYIDADDLIKILKLLNTRIKDTHKQSTKLSHRVALAISHMLDSMVDSQVKDLSLQQLHEPLSDYLRELQESSEPYFVYQAAYSYQAMQYIPYDKTILQTGLQRTGKVTRRVSRVVSDVKALDLPKFIEGLEGIQAGLTDARNVITLDKDAHAHTKVEVENGQELLESLKEGFNFTRKSAWYPALRGLDRLLQEGRYSDFEVLVREAPCRHNPAFQLGVCQRLGELAANTTWDINSRKCAVTFLGELSKDNAKWGQRAAFKQSIFSILGQLVNPSYGIISDQASALLQELGTDGTAEQLSQHQAYKKDGSVSYPVVVVLPPQKFPLLDRVQNKSDVEVPLRQLRNERLKSRDGDVYILPRAKSHQSATEDFDLTTKVQEFLQSNRKVFLIMGDSGAGKSVFNRALEISLWDKYGKSGGRIPLYIHLPSIEKPEQDLIAERLRRINFTENQIRELKSRHEFIVICDGYDEVQQNRNLYVSNQFNQPGGWRAQMVISCRTEYIGVDHRGRFQPYDKNGCGNPDLFQEAIIEPFSNNQIQDYVDQYVSSRKPLWKSDIYLQAFRQIPDLQDLVRSPILLKLAVEVLPEILETDGRFSSACITRVTLYDEFVARWIEGAKVRLGEADLSSNDRKAFQGLADSGFKQIGFSYLKHLATAIYDNQNGNPVVSYSEHRDRTTWKEAFFNKEDGEHLIRESVPLTRDGGQYRFIHRSILEYGMALAVFDPTEHDEDIEQSSDTTRRGSTSSDLSFENHSTTETTVNTVELHLLDSPLGKRSLVGESSILQFLSERVKQHSVFKDQLLSVIERSKTDKTARIAAANAITILVRAGVQFNEADLRGIQIPGADLSYGVFDSAQLEGADLLNVNLRNTWLREADLSGAQMTGVQFGEPQSIQVDTDVCCCLYSPNGKTFAVGLINGWIYLYETKNWSRIQTLKGSVGGMVSLAFSPKSDQIASGGQDMTVRLWSVATGDCVLTIRGHKGKVAAVAYSPTGDQIVSGSWDSTVRLWDINNRSCIQTLQGHSSYVTSAVYSPKGDQVASGSYDWTIRLWNVDTGKCLRILNGHNHPVTSIVYSPKGDRVVSGSWDKTIRLWDVDTGNCVRALQAHSGWVTTVVYSPNGNHIASGSDDKTVRLWDVETGDCIRTIQSHKSRITSVVYSPEGSQIASGSWDETVQLQPWDSDAHDYARSLSGHLGEVVRVVHSPKGGQVASASNDGTVRLWDSNTGSCLHTLRGHSGEVTSIVYSPKGGQIAGEIINLAYSPQGNELASGSSDGTLQLWDVDTGRCIKTLDGHSSSITFIVYSPTGDRIATGSHDITVRLWSVETHQCVYTLKGHGDFVTSAVYSPNGDRIASGGHDNTVRLWNVNNGDCIQTLSGHSSPVTSVVYSPKGDQIASASDDKTIQLWDAETGNCIHTLQGHGKHITSIVYSPKGDMIASGSYDETVRLWSVESGQCLVIIPEVNGVVNSIVWENAFGHHYLTTGGSDKSVRRWQVIEGDRHKVLLCWSSSHHTLTVTGASFKDAQGLSLVNQKLLSQRHALDTKSSITL